MANAIVTVKIMPESPEVDLASLTEEVKKKIADFAGEGDTREEIEPVAFGLKALKITFVMDESMGSPEPVEKEIEALKGVNSVEVIDVRRAIG
ncbi:elongation factor 1-beta [Candidatus Woesearchaeota archaeon]|nr:elongation factor 1-beta [Candidatus Woesearchaeota archaeon]